MSFIIQIVSFLIILPLVLCIFKRYRRRQQIPQTQIPIIQEVIKEDIKEKKEIEVIPITKQSTIKSNTNEQNYHRKKLIDEEAFQISDNSDNEKDEERNSSSNQSSDHKQNNVFQFQEGEQKLDDLIEQEN